MDEEWGTDRCDGRNDAVIPGIIAFAVDFATGAIYLPPGEASLQNVPDDWAGMVAKLPDRTRDVSSIPALHLPREFAKPSQISIAVLNYSSQFLSLLLVLFVLH